MAPHGQRALLFTPALTLVRSEGAELEVLGTSIPERQARSGGRKARLSTAWKTGLLAHVWINFRKSVEWTLARKMPNKCWNLLAPIGMPMPRNFFLGLPRLSNMGR